MIETLEPRSHEALRSKSFTCILMMGSQLSSTFLGIEALCFNFSSLILMRASVTCLVKAKFISLASIPRKVEDSWEPIINMQVNDFDLKASCDLGSSVSITLRKIYEMLDLPPLEDCYLDVPLNDNAKKKLMGSINDVLIMVNNAYVPVDFYVLDVEYNASCPITLGRPFLRTVGAIIDMKEGTIKYNFTFKKGVEHFPMRRENLPFAPPLKAKYLILASCA